MSSSHDPKNSCDFYLAPNRLSLVKNGILLNALYNCAVCDLAQKEDEEEGEIIAPKPEEAGIAFQGPNGSNKNTFMHTEVEVKVNKK